MPSTLDTAPVLAAAYDRPSPAVPWRRPLIGSLLLVALWGAGALALVVVAAVVGVLSGAERQGGFPVHPLWDAFSGPAVVALAIPAVLLATRWLRGRPAGVVSSVAGGLRWHWLLTCLALALPAVALSLALPLALRAGGSLDEAPWVGWASFVPLALGLLILVPFQAAGEEYVYRGWVVQFFGAYLRTPWPGIVVSAVLFAASHGFTDGWRFGELALFGVLTAWVTVRTGGLEAAIVYHAVYNVGAFLAGASIGALDASQSAAAASWPLLAADLLARPLYAMAVVRASNRCPDRPVSHQHCLSW